MELRPFVATASTKKVRQTKKIEESLRLGLDGGRSARQQNVLDVLSQSIFNFHLVRVTTQVD